MFAALHVSFVQQTFSFLAILVFVFLVIWMILFLALKWNEKVVKYTNKEAAPNLSKC